MHETLKQQGIRRDQRMFRLISGGLNDNPREDRLEPVKFFDIPPAKQGETEANRKVLEGIIDHHWFPETCQKVHNKLTSDGKSNVPSDPRALWSSEEIKQITRAHNEQTFQQRNLALLAVSVGYFDDFASELNQEKNEEAEEILNRSWDNSQANVALKHSQIDVEFSKMFFEQVDSLQRSDVDEFVSRKVETLPIGDDVSFVYRSVKSL